MVNECVPGSVGTLRCCPRGHARWFPARSTWQRCLGPALNPRVRPSSAGPRAGCSADRGPVWKLLTGGFRAARWPASGSGRPEPPSRALTCPCPSLQLPGVEACENYTFRYGRNPLMELPLAVNPTGCARSEPKMSAHVKRFVLRYFVLTSHSTAQGFCA